MSFKIRTDASGNGQFTIDSTDVLSINTDTTVSLPTGTANGIAYLNGSKVLTSGSALTFDGTNLRTGGITFADTSTQNTGGYTGFRNRIINGAMMIDQRNAGASVTPTNSDYTLDRWKCLLTQSSVFSVQQNLNSVTPPAGFTNYLGAVSLASTSLGSSDRFVIQQPIEGYNISDLGFGTANAKPVALSFWVRSSLTGTFGGSLVGGVGPASYPYSYTIDSANTWEYKTVFIPGPTIDTWNSTTSNGVAVRFSLGCGTGQSGTANAWAASTNVSSVTGAVSVVGTSGATFYITGVQLEKGSVATPFEFRPYGTELALCQRYYQEFGYNGVVGQGQYTDRNSGSYVSFPVPMRTTPTTIAKQYEVDIGDLVVNFTPLLYTNALGQGIGWRPYRNVATTITRGDTMDILTSGTNLTTAGGPRHPFDAEL